MATSSVRQTIVTFTGDAPNTISITNAANALSPGTTQIISLTAGANTITAPNISGIAASAAVWIIPPALNAVSITLKGVTGDTGISLNLTDTTILALPTPFTSFVLTVGAGGILGVRLVWI